MPNNTLLVTQESFNTYSQFSMNIDVKQYKSSILVAQQIRFYKCLGNDLIDELQSQIQSNTITPNNQILLDMLAPSLVFYTYFEALPFLWVKGENAGLVINNPEATQTVNKGDMIYLRGNLETTGDFYKRELLEYLDQNYTLYPLYPYTNCDTCSNKKSGGATGIIFY